MSDLPTSPIDYSEGQTTGRIRDSLGHSWRIFEYSNQSFADVRCKSCGLKDVVKTVYTGDPQKLLRAAKRSLAVEFGKVPSCTDQIARTITT